MKAYNAQLFRHVMVQFGLVLITSTALAFLTSAVKPAQASAAYCGVHTGSMSSLAGLIVEVNWVPYGSTSRQATGGGVSVRVWNVDGRGD